MITGFLFFDKVLANREHGINWPKFLLGRFLRLTPLYVVSITLLLLVVAVESGGTLAEPLSYVLRCAARWYAFAIFDQPNVNTIGAWMINSGVAWSLPYEWFFYLSLPLLAVCCGTRVRWPYMLIALATLAFASAAGYKLIYGVIFLGGILR